MFQTFKARSFQSGLLSICLAAATGLALITPSQEALAGDAGPVKCDELKNAKLKGYCAKNDGKRAKIKNVMKKAQEAYKKESGNEVKCVTCHETGDGGKVKEADSKKHWDAFEKQLNTALDAAK